MKTINSVQMGNTQNQNNDSTMKTINSVQMGSTNGQDTLAFSTSLTPKQRMQLKK